MYLTDLLGTSSHCSNLLDDGDFLGQDEGDACGPDAGGCREDEETEGQCFLGVESIECATNEREMKGL